MTPTTILIKSLQLAADADIKKLKFPYMVQPKYDGVRGANMWGRMLARSLRPFSNKYTGSFFSQAPFLGFDGELAAGPEDSESLCRDTTSALNTIGGQPWLLWHVFDYITPQTIDLAYEHRYQKMRERVFFIQGAHPELSAHMRIIPSIWCGDMEGLEIIIAQHCNAGYEGTILRDPCGLHKNGRSSPAHNGLLRIKPFIEVDAIVTKIYEGQSNNNEPTLNRLGLTERSTHKEFMVSNGMIGAMDAVLLEDAKHPITGTIVHSKGETVRFGAGRMTHDERLNYFENQMLFIGQRIKGQIFAHGVKDKPRFPTFQAIRMAADVR